MLPKNVNVPCKFPFTYQGKEYHKCTKKDNNKEWCAMDMSHHLSPNGPDCKACWKNETYKWGVCDHNTCELGEQLNNNFKKFYACPQPKNVVNVDVVAMILRTLLVKLRISNSFF